VTINSTFAALVAALVDEVPAPLSQRFTLAALWCDLARLNGETPPAAVAIIAEGLPVALPPVVPDASAEPRRERAVPAA
jgi:hypothetical protein